MPNINAITGIPFGYNDTAENYPKFGIYRGVGAGVNVAEFERRVKEKGLGKDATIIIICRSGDRTSKAQDRLAAAGYTKVYSIAEGFEGDTAKGGTQDGQRVVNGWKNAGLPWTYKLDKARMYFPH